MLFGLFGGRKRNQPQKVYERAVEIYQDLEELIQSAKTEFFAIGTSFDRSPKHCQVAIEERLSTGVHFTYIHLSKNAEFSLFAPQFGQTTEELRGEVQSTYSVFERLRQRFPKTFRSYPTKRCPNYRMYVADPHSESPAGIIVFYGSATDSPLLPAYKIANFKLSPWSSYLTDLTNFVERKSSNKVFVIHGHAEAQWRALKEMLEGMGLDPVILKQQPGRGRTILEKFMDHAKQCVFAVAVFTPDDMVRVKEPVGEEGYYQPRPNAIFEVGWFAGTLGRERVVVICQEGVEMFSDFHGVDVLTFRQSIEEVYMKLEQELRDEEIL